MEFKPLSCRTDMEIIIKINAEKKDKMVCFSTFLLPKLDFWNALLLNFNLKNNFRFVWPPNWDENLVSEILNDYCYRGGMDRSDYQLLKINKNNFDKVFMIANDTNDEHFKSGITEYLTYSKNIINPDRPIRSFTYTAKFLSELLNASGFIVNENKKYGIFRYDNGIPEMCISLEHMEFSRDQKDFILKLTNLANRHISINRILEVAFGFIIMFGKGEVSFPFDYDIGKYSQFLSKLHKGEI